MHPCFSIKAVRLYVAVLVLVSGIFCSCANTRRLTYLQGSFDTAALSQVQYPDPVIQKGDLLSIVVYSDNPQATAFYNQSVITTTSGSAGGAAGGTDGGAGGVSGTGAVTAPGYLVDPQGNIVFQSLGLIHVEGLTKATLKDTLTERLKNYLRNPYLSIRFLNNRVTILGEVTKPGQYGIPGDHLNLLQALGLAGDMTVYGRRDNILVIREENGKRTFGRMDITKPEIMESPYFNLQQGDVIVVDQHKTKAASSDLTMRNVTIAATVVTAIAVLVNLLRY